MRNKIVLVRTEAGLTLGNKNSDHFERQGFQANGFADGILAAEEFFADGGADDAYRSASPQLLTGEIAPGIQFPVSYREEGIVAAGNLSGPVFAAINGLGGRTGGRRHRRQS